MTKTELIKEYEAYLDELVLTKKTRYSYKYKLKQYLQKNDIDTRTERRKKRKQEKARPYGLANVYHWQELTPPKKTHKTGWKKKTKPKTDIQSHAYDDPLLQQFVTERNIQPATVQGYSSTLIRYFQYTGFTSIQEMIDEAEQEEQERVPLKESKLKKRLLGYRTHLLQTVENANTVKTYLSKVITIYNHYEIRVPKLPQMKTKKQYQVSYYDLPNKEHIQKAINHVTQHMKALILFMSSSGTAKAETLSITIEMFLQSIREKTNKTSLRGIVEDLSDRKDLVPIIYLKRIKTDKYYYTCCSPEATHHILLSLLQRINDEYNPLTDEKEKLFPYNSSYVMKQFQQINDSLGFGFVGSYRFFRTHTLRKFHASNLGTSAEIIDELEGRSKNTVHETYIKTKPDKLRTTYMEHMHNIMINTSDYIGPHLGGEREEEQLKNSIVELVPDLVPTLEKVTEIQQQAQVVQPQMVQQAPFDYNILKDIARLENRMDALEKRLKQLGG